MSVASILKSKGGNVVTVSGDTAVREIVALLHKHRIGAVLVTDAGKPVGVVSERDVVKCLHARGAGILDAAADAIMSSPVVTVALGDSVQDAMATMTDYRIRHLPVVEDGRLIGIVSIGDLVKARIDEAEHEAAQLKSYITA